GGGLAHEDRAAPRVDPERPDQRDLREQPVDVEEAVVAPRAVDEVRPEHRAHVDVRQHEVVGNGGRGEEGCAGDQRRAPEGGERDLQKVSPKDNSWNSGRGSGSGSRRIGAPYGYPSVRSSRYDHVCAE